MGMDCSTILISTKRLSRRQVKRIYNSCDRRRLGSVYYDLECTLDSVMSIEDKFAYCIDTRSSLLEDYIKSYNYKDCVLIENPDEWGEIIVCTPSIDGRWKRKRYSDELDNKESLKEWSEIAELSIEDLRKVLSKFLLGLDV